MKTNNTKPIKLNIGLIGAQAESFLLHLKKYEPTLIPAISDITSDFDVVCCCSLAAIIPSKYLNLPKYGIFVIHSSNLPEGRGWAPIEWTVLNGLDRVTLTLFRAEEGMDSGPWIFKESFPISRLDTISSLRERDLITAVSLYSRLIDLIKSGTSIKFKQQKGIPSYWPKRTPFDSELNPNKSIAELWDKIRVCDNENYPAFFYIDGVKIIIKYEVCLNKD